MSRGHGKIERRVLELLSEDEPGVFFAIQLTTQVFECPTVSGVKLVTRAQVHAVQRALRTLAAEGLVAALGGRLSRRKVWLEKSRADELIAGLDTFRAWQVRQAAARAP